MPLAVDCERRAADPRYLGEKGMQQRRHPAAFFPSSRLWCLHRTGGARQRTRCPVSSNKLPFFFAVRRGGLLVVRMSAGSNYFLPPTFVSRMIITKHSGKKIAAAPCCSVTDRVTRRSEPSSQLLVIEIISGARSQHSRPEKDF